MTKQTDKKCMKHKSTFTILIHPECALFFQ